jgi:hypothetical protein
MDNTKKEIKSTAIAVNQIKKTYSDLYTCSLHEEIEIADEVGHNNRYLIILVNINLTMSEKRKLSMLRLLLQKLTGLTIQVFESLSDLPPLLINNKQIYLNRKLLQLRFNALLEGINKLVIYLIKLPGNAIQGVKDKLPESSLPTLRTRKVISSITMHLNEVGVVFPSAILSSAGNMQAVVITVANEIIIRTHDFKFTTVIAGIQLPLMTEATTIIIDAHTGEFICPLSIIVMNELKCCLELVFSVEQI